MPFAAGTPAADGFPSVLQRAGERVERYFARALSIICLEVVHLQPLAPDLTSRGFGRTVESELRVSWTPEADGAPSTEAQTLRNLLRVNGHPPRSDDWDNCTAPEQQRIEPHLLSLLLPGRRPDYAFALAGEERIEGRLALVVDYRLQKPLVATSRMVAGRDDCISLHLEGGVRGRLWIDADTFDVLRLDQRLSSQIEIPLPREAARRAGDTTRWTIDRWDTTVRFKAVTFSDPDESVVLPASLSSLRITRGSATPRLRTTTEYRNYKRFLTGGRVVGE